MGTSCTKHADAPAVSESQASIDEPVSPKKCAIDAKVEYESQALKSQELDIFAAITAKASELLGYGLKLYTPKIAVVGGQGAGKSSIFNVLLEQVGSIARFPARNGTCTKVPIVLTLKRLKPGMLASVTIAGGGMSSTLTTTASSSEVLAAIDAAQTRILKAEHSDYSEDNTSPFSIRFSQTPVTITAVAPRVATESLLVDLPGLVAGAQGAVVEAIVRAHIEQPNTLIIAAGKSDNDKQVDAGLALAEEVDPTGARTLRMHTFYRYARAELQAAIREAIASPADPTHRAHILDLERLSNSGKLIEAPQVAGVPADAQGIDSFLLRSAEKLGPIARGAKPELHRQLLDAAKDIGQRLDTIGRDPPSSDEIFHEKVAPLFRALKKRADELTSIATTRDDGINVNTEIQRFQGELTRHGISIIDEFDIKYWTICELEPMGFQGTAEMTCVVRRIMERWIVPFHNLMSAYRDVYASALDAEPVRPRSASSNAGSDGSSTGATNSLADSLFHRIDTNHDRRITPEEMRAHMRGKERVEAEGDALFDRIDVSGDGIVTVDEMRAYVHTRGIADFHDCGEPRSVLDRFDVPEALKQHIRQRWNDLIEEQIKQLTRKMVPSDDGEETSVLEKMMRTPPPHDVAASVALSFGRCLEDLKARMRALPDTVHEQFERLAEQRGETYDVAALRNDTSYTPPMIVLKVAETRVKIREEAEAWVGFVRESLPTGRALGFLSQVRDQVHHHHSAFDEFVTGQLRDEPSKQFVRECFEAEFKLHEAERAMLRKREALVSESLELLSKL